MSAKLFWQTLLVWWAARTMLGMTSRFRWHSWNWSGTSPVSSQQWWFSSQTTPLPLSVSPLWGEDRCQRGGGTTSREGQPQKGVLGLGAPPGAITHSHWMAAESPR